MPFWGLALRDLAWWRKQQCDYTNVTGKWHCMHTLVVSTAGVGKRVPKNVPNLHPEPRTVTQLISVGMCSSEPRDFKASHALGKSSQHGPVFFSFFVVSAPFRRIDHSRAMFLTSLLSLSLSSSCSLPYWGERRPTEQRDRSRRKRESTNSDTHQRSKAKAMKDQTEAKGDIEQQRDNIQIQRKMEMYRYRSGEGHTQRWRHAYIELDSEVNIQMGIGRGMQIQVTM